MALPPSISLWPLGRLCSWLRMVTFLQMGLSVMCLPQSRSFDDGVLYLGVARVCLIRSSIFYALNYSHSVLMMQRSVSC